MKRAAPLLLAMMFAAGCSGTGDPPPQDASQSQSPERPNILVIVTDDQRADGTMRAMPETKRFFKSQGTEFTQAFATTPLCCPSRASIFSGQYVHNHGVRYNDLSTKLNHDQTLQAYLQEAGYRTAITGKYLNRWPDELDPPYFEDFAIWLQGPYYTNAKFNVGGEQRRVPGYANDFIRKTAVSYLQGFEDNDAQPWFLYVGVTAPHSPYIVEDKYKGADVYPFRANPAVREKNLSDKPDFGPGKRSRYRLVRRKQIRTLYSADDLVERVMNEARALNEDRDTVAFFLSDNGQLWGEHGRTAKRYPYLQSVKIPFFMRWPGQIEPGGRDGRLAANIDLAPTALDAAGIALPEEFDGRSLLGDRRREKILLEHWQDDESEVPTWAGLLTRDYQYVEYYRRSGERFVREYYDLEQDPWQLRNLFGDASRRNDPEVSDLSSELARLRRCEGRSCP